MPGARIGSVAGLNCGQVALDRLRDGTRFALGVPHVHPKGALPVLGDDIHGRVDVAGEHLVDLHQLPVDVVRVSLLLPHAELIDYALDGVGRRPGGG